MQKNGYSEDVFTHFPFLKTILFFVFNDFYINYEFCNYGVSRKLWAQNEKK